MYGYPQYVCNEVNGQLICNGVYPPGFWIEFGVSCVVLLIAVLCVFPALDFVSQSFDKVVRMIRRRKRR